jgi:hypothetical protein
MSKRIHPHKSGTSLVVSITEYLREIGVVPFDENVADLELDEIDDVVASVHGGAILLVPAAHDPDLVAKQREALEYIEYETKYGNADVSWL